MFAIFRIGRFALRAGANASAGPKGPVKPWGWPGQLLFWAIVAVLLGFAHVLVPVLICAGILVGGAFLWALAVAGERRKPAAKPQTKRR